MPQPSTAAAQPANELERVFYAHEFQARALTSKARYIILVAGIQGGKTICGAHWLWIQANRFPKDHHLVGFPTYRIFEQSTWPALEKVLTGMGTMNWQRMCFALWTGGKIFFRSAEKPSGIEGITNVRSIWLDEAGEIKYSAWINYEGRSSFKQAQICMTTTPYALNWLYHDFVVPWRRGERKDCDLITFPSIANPYFPKEEYERQRAIMDPRLFARRYGGEWTRMEGLVYELDQDLNYMAPSPLPVGTRIFGGIDWGYAASPFALVVRAYTPQGEHWAITEFKAPGLTPSEVVRIVKQKADLHRVEHWACDSSRPDMIEELNRAGVVAIPATHDIVAGIELHRELVQSRMYRLWKGCTPELSEEYELYAYPVAQPDHEMPDMPLPLNNHLMDAERYCTWSIRHLFQLSARQPSSGARSQRQLAVAKHFDPAARIAWLTKRRTTRRGGYYGRRAS